MTTLTYQFDDVVQALNEVVAHDWARRLTEAVESREVGAPLDWLERGGYRLVYRDHRTDFCKRYDAFQGQFDLRFSIGLLVSDGGAVQEVMWGCPAFEAGMTPGSTIKTVNGQPYDHMVFGDVIEEAQGGAPIRLEVETRGRVHEVAVTYDGGHRFPHLEPVEGARKRLEEIYAAR